MTNSGGSSARRAPEENINRQSAFYFALEKESEYSTRSK
jgi:hypothetical protein